MRRAQVSPETLMPWKPCRYGYSHLIGLPKSKAFLVIGPHWPGVLTTMVVIVGATMMNLKYIATNSNLSPWTTAVLYMIVAIGFSSTNIFLLLTALSDPGIVFISAHAGDAEALVNNPDGYFCEDCRIQEPVGVRMDHCNTCGYCIEGLDHHCPWMGQCVGKKNMKWFILFNMSWVLYFIEFIFTAIVCRVS